MPTLGEACVPLSNQPPVVFVIPLPMQPYVCLPPECIAPMLACQLIALDKNPGVRPIGIGDTARHITTKAAISVLKDEVLDVAGSMQLCVGQIGDIESAIHAARKKFDSPEPEAVLLIDAFNAFNSLNRKAALHKKKSYGINKRKRSIKLANHPSN